MAVGGRPPQTEQAALSFGNLPPHCWHDLADVLLSDSRTGLRQMGQIRSRIGQPRGVAGGAEDGATVRHYH